MSRQVPLLSVALTAALFTLSGCQPQQPFYFFEDGDMSHYKGMATEIEYPDLEQCQSPEVDGTGRPYSLGNQDAKEPTNLRLEEAIHIALSNNKVMRSIGGQIQGPPDFIARNPELVAHHLGSGDYREQSADRRGSGAVGVRRAVAFGGAVAEVQRAAEHDRGHRRHLPQRAAGRQRHVPEPDPQSGGHRHHVRPLARRALRRQQQPHAQLPQRLDDAVAGRIPPSVVAGQRRAVQPHRRPRRQSRACTTA